MVFLICQDTYDTTMRTAKDWHWCPFEGCKSGYERKSTLKEHLLKIRGNRGNEHHQLNDPMWDELDKTDLLEIHTRPTNLSDVDIANRRRASAARYREKHKFEINEARRNRSQDLQTFADNIRDVAKIAVFALDDVDNSEGRVVRGLYDKDNTHDPQTILDITAPPTVSTFPTMVAIFLPPSDWPTIITSSRARVKRDLKLLIKQLPGRREFEAVNKILSPRMPEPQLIQPTRGTIVQPWVDRRRHPDRLPSPEHRPILHFRGAARVQLGEDEEDIFGLHDVPCDPALAAHLTAAYEIWKPVVEDKTLANVQFVLHQDDSIVFTATSSQHAQGLTLLQTWEDVSITMLKKYTPKYSLAELHMYRNQHDGYSLRSYLDRAWEAGDEDKDKDEDEDEDEDMYEDEDEVSHNELKRRKYARERKKRNKNNEIDTLYRVLSLKGKRKPGPKKAKSVKK